MSEADEDYDEPESSSSRSSRASDSSRSSDGIAGLNTNPEGIQAPTRVPGLSMAIPGARSANFGQLGRMFPEPEQERDHHMQQSDDDDDDLVRLLVRGDPNPNDDDVVNRLMRSQIASQIGPNAEQVLNRIQPQPRAYSAQELTQIRQRRRDQRQQEQLRIIWQNCDRPRLLRLFASIDRANRAHDERALLRVLQQLQYILVANGATRSHSREFRRFGCRTPEARRALHAFISRLRNQIARRLRAMITRRGPPPPQTQSQSQSQSRKGGKRQTKTKKMAFKRNKTVKRR